MEVLARKQTRTTFSTSLLEFVIRAAFLTAHTMDHFAVHDNSAVNPEDDIVDHAAAEVDPLEVFSKRDSRKRAKSQINEMLEKHMKKQNSMGLEVSLKQSVSMKHYNVEQFKDAEKLEQALQVAEKVWLAESERRSQIQNAAPSEEGQVSVNTTYIINLPLHSSRGLKAYTHHRNPVIAERALGVRAFPSDEEPDRQHDFGDMARLEERLHVKVQNMFDPALFRKGSEFDSYLAALMELERIPKEELRLWMDIFEPYFLRHNHYEHTRISRFSGKVRDSALQVGSSLKELEVEHSWDQEDIARNFENTFELSSNILRDMRMDRKPPPDISATSVSKNGAQRSLATHCKEEYLESHMAQGLESNKTLLRFTMAAAWTSMARDSEELIMKWARLAIRAGGSLGSSVRLEVTDCAPLIRRRRDRKERELRRQLAREEELCHAEERRKKCLEEELSQLQLSLGSTTNPARESSRKVE